jgi:hypothetical protein
MWNKKLFILGALLAATHAYAGTGEEEVVLVEPTVSTAATFPNPYEFTRHWAFLLFPFATVVLVGFHLKKSPYIRVRKMPPLDSLLPPPGEEEKT